MNNLDNQPVPNCFSRPVKVDRVKSKGLREKVTATSEECEGLAGQLAIEKVDAVQFNCVLMPWKKGGVHLKGQLTATVQEICVVTLEPFTTRISQEVKRYFERAGRSGTEIPVIDMEAPENDVPDVLEDGKLDIGDIAIETLALCLSPHPRKPGAVFADHVESDPDNKDDPAKENPFDVLKQLKKH